MATLPINDQINIDDLTEAKVDGDGVFDVLMRAVKAHIHQEFTQSRLKGPEYATVYLGSLEAAMQTGMAFLLGAKKAALEAQLLEQQIILAGVEVTKAEAQVRLVEAEIEKMAAELPLINAQVAKAEAEVRLLELQEQKLPAEIALLEQQKLNLEDDLLTSAKQRDRLTQEIENLGTQKLQIEAETDLVEQRVLNAVTEGLVLVAQECLLKAQFDNTEANTLKAKEETLLLAQKTVTERAQVASIGVDADSVIGKQKTLYTAQADGFQRDAEQKVAKTMIDTWSVRRTTDEGTVADGTNKLSDVHVGRAVEKLLTGVNA